MPFAIMVSAVPLISCSSMLAANVFQEFHPIGGVSARPSNFWAKAVAVRPRAASRRIFLMGAVVGKGNFPNGTGKYRFDRMARLRSIRLRDQSPAGANNVLLGMSAAGISFVDRSNMN